MRRETVKCFLTILAAVAAVSLTARGASADAYEEIVKYGWDQGRGAPASIEAEIRAAKAAPARRAVEAKLIKALTDPQATFECKQFVCRMLRYVGSPACVPAVAKLLPDAKLSHMARFALQHLPGPEAASALREALGKVDGELKLGMISSIAGRRDGQAVPALGELAAGSDAALARAAIAALGRIASPAAAKSLGALRAPGSLKDEWADACLLCADGMLAGGGKAEAGAIYRKMFAKEMSKPVRIAALRGIVLAERQRAAKLLLGLLADADADLGRAAGKFVIEMPGKAATKAFASALASMAPAGQALLIDALTARGDTAAAPDVARLVESKDQGVRIAAIRALAVLGDGTSVPMLAKAASAGGEIGKAALESLNRLKGEGVGEAMSKLLDSPDPAFRAAMLNVLTARADKAMIPAMLKAARDKDQDVRKAAAKGLAAVAGGKELPDLVALLLAAEDGSERAGLERAVASAAMRVDDLDARAAPVAAGLAKADPAAKARLVTLLGRFGGGKALAAVRAQLRSPNAEVATEAVRALHAWPDDAPAGDLLEIIKTTKDRTHKVLAFRGYIRMANMPERRGAAETTAMYKQALQLATGAAEKKSVLSGLANARSVEALRLVDGLLSDDALKAEAQLAYLQIAGNARDAAPDEARAAVKKIIASAKNDALRNRARGILNEMDKYRGYITSWLISGPYTKGSAYETAFPPERPGAKGVTWQALTKGVGPQVIDLSKTLGGNERAAYMKTSVWSPAEQDVRLEMGSDDGIKVWINGKLVHAKNASRPCKPGEDTAKAHLVKGANSVLVKIAQGGGDWAFCVRICKPDGAALEGLRVSLEGR